MHLLMITVLALLAVASGDPAVILSGSLISSPLTSAALTAQAPAPVVSPVSQFASLYPLSSYSSVSSVAQVAPVAQVASLSPLSYSAYGNAYSYQDYYPVVNSALSLPYTSLPYAYAADYYYRK